MSCVKALMMLPSFLYSPSAHESDIKHPGRLRHHHNTPEEVDETVSMEDCDISGVLKPAPSANQVASSDGSLYSDRDLEEERERSQFVLSYCPYQPPRGLPAGYSQPTPYPSQVQGSWLHPSLNSNWSGQEYPSSLPSCLPNKEGLSGSVESMYSSRNKFLSLPSRYSHTMGSLEQPRSLHSNEPSISMHHHTLSPYYCSPPGAACCAQCPAESHTRGPVAHHAIRHGHQPPYGPYYDCRIPGAGYMPDGPVYPAKQSPPHNAPLSLEQRRVFVTYEADNDKHIKEIINFAALLRTNGFDTHIDMFEQQFRSISKIDFMERYLSEKEYLIIIIISPKYYETVTASPLRLENDERTLTTVYIHKQLQNEFIQNGSKNFRFIPILFPGAKRCHVPNWLQNTHVYGWPRDRDDILRRLMRVEKYNPPPIGELPTIVSIPI